MRNGAYHCAMRRMAAKLTHGDAGRETVPAIIQRENTHSAYISGLFIDAISINFSIS